MFIIEWANHFPSIAANVLGDLERAQEFYNRARHKVSQFFDVSDYTVAEALASMAYFAFGQVWLTLQRRYNCKSLS